MAPMKNPKVTRKQTGTVPKTTTTTPPAAASFLRSSHATPPKSASSVKDPHSTTSSSSQKNTEIVAPIRRDLSDFNEYILSVAESSATTQTASKRSTGNSNEQSQSEPLDSTCFELDNLNLHENQRYCWPVRPLPRRSSPNRDFGSEIQPSLPPTNIGHLHSLNYSTSSASGLSSQAIGVVIPTTPNSTLNDNYVPLNRLQHFPTSITNNSNSIANYHHQQQQHQQLHPHQSEINQSLATIDSELTWEQRLNFIQYFLSLTTKNLNKEKEEVGVSKGLNSRVSEEIKKMVNETQSELYLNSTSLEDVANSEANDTRAHSVTSIHSASNPNTPTYEELQAKLEASNRNIASIKEQQHQLFRIQQAAKDHLVEMENIRNQRNCPTYYNQNGSAPPNYESIGQVQSDMANLVGRMKNLTSFIQGQNELSNLLGEDGPEILAEQEALQNKLLELQRQKEDMRNLVHELEEINTDAENTAKQRRQDTNEVPRVVPIEYQRIVPIELIGAAKIRSESATDMRSEHDIMPNGHCNGNADHDIPDDSASTSVNQDDEADMTDEASAVIKQKMTDIAAMKNQLKRLKDMMDTVKLIEDKTDGRSIQQIADEAEQLLESTVREQRASNERTRSNRSSVHKETGPKESVPIETQVRSVESANNEPEMTEKVRILHEMTQDLRNQAASLASERDRLRVLRDEMIRRKEAENLEAETKRAASSQNSKEVDSRQLRAEFDAKKKEFEKLCERLHSDTEIAEDEADCDHKDESVPNTKHSSNNGVPFYHENWRPQNIVSSNSSGRDDASGAKQSTVPPTPCRGKDSADSGAADVHGITSFEAGSLQSGSSRSFSMPPPMRTLNTRETTWRKNSQDNSQSQFDMYAPMPPPPPTWNPAYYYSTPYAQHFNLHSHHHPMNPATGDYFCSHNCHPPNTMGQNMPPTNSGPQQSNQQSTTNTNDPVLLQQFIQTQQMLINSVCQCNQLLWHQQREINNLNNAVMMLQDRLLHPINSEANQNIHRAESVPPTGATVSGNMYTSHRAQSEQPNQPYQSIQQPLSSPSRHHHFHSYNYASNYHRRNVHSIHQQLPSNATAYNFSSSDHHAAGVCAQLPPIAPQPPLNHTIDYSNVPHTPQTSNFLNNDVPHSANIHQQHPAPQPIYMHHHNNTIAPADVGTVGANMQSQQQQLQGPNSVPPPPHHHTNNHSNLLTSQQQNCLNSPPAANIPQSTVTSSTITHGPSNLSNAATAASALNNQVPPGNRANNYWDNFRSYSRQNLLSTNSCKSNEEQQQASGVPAFPVNAANTNLNGFRNLHNAMNAINAISTGNSASYSNNLTPPTFDNKHVYTFRNHLNSNIYNEHDSQNPLNHTSTQLADSLVHNLPVAQGGNYLLNSSAQHAQENRVGAGVLINQGTQSDNLNINSSTDFHNTNGNNNTGSNNTSASIAALFASSDFRNMNFNLGANELRKKISIKSACATKRIRHSQSMTNEISQSNRGSNSSQLSLGSYDDNAGVGVVNEMGAAATGINSRNIYAELDNQQQMESEFNDDDNANADNSNASGYSESSEENKKNLLANALRNDKFTSKFFERLKEDVYREVYSILQATESQPQYLEQLYKELQLVPTNDPIRNIVMQAMHDIYKRSSIVNNESSENYSNNIPETNNSAVSPYESVNQSPTIQSESNQENELMNTLLNSTELRRLAYKIMFESERSISPIGKVGTKPNISSSSTSSSPKPPPTEMYRPDYDLVNHILAIIRNSIHSQRIDDDVIMKITKLTISTLERISSSLGNNTLQINRLAISPKELYRRMKSFDRRDYEGFLLRLESFLQTMFVMKIVNDDANNFNLMSMKKASSSNANLLSNSAESQNARRHNLVAKSNISSNSGSHHNSEANGNRKIKRHQGEGTGTARGEATNVSGGLASTRSTPDEFKRVHHSIQKNSSKSRRSESNTNQLHFVANSNFLNDISPQSDTLSSPTVSSNNITNEDLAEADQVCSSSTLTVSCDTASGSSIKFSRNTQQPSRHQRNQQQDHYALSSVEHHPEMDDNKNCDWPRKESVQSNMGDIHTNAKQEAESENFETFPIFPKSHKKQDHHDHSSNAIDNSVDDIDEVTSSYCSNGLMGNILEADTIFNDAACAANNHHVNQNLNINSTDSSTDGDTNQSQTPTSAGNHGSVDGKRKNGVP